MSRTCTTKYFSVEPCGEPATLRMTLGCVHEHINEYGKCDLHAEVVHHCPECRTGAAPHLCDLAVVSSVRLESVSL